MLTLAVDSSVLIFELHYLSMSTNTLFQLLDASFVLIYITEFALKVIQIISICCKKF